MPTYDDVLRWVRPGHEYHQHRYARGLAASVPVGARWLDLGAGTQLHHGWIGPSCENLAARAATLVGCDVVEEHIATNRSLTAAVVSDANALPFATDSFDVVTANMVLEHLEHPHLVFAEVARVLSPGGLFLFVTPNVLNPIVGVSARLLSQRARQSLAAFVDRREPEHIFPTFYRANSTRALHRLGADASLRLRELDHFCTHPILSRPWPLTLVEAVWIKLIRRGPLQGLGTNLFGVMERV